MTDKLTKRDKNRILFSIQVLLGEFPYIKKSEHLMNSEKNELKELNEKLIKKWKIHGNPQFE